MGHTACTEPQCLYKGAFYFTFTHINLVLCSPLLKKKLWCPHLLDTGPLQNQILQFFFEESGGVCNGCFLIPSYPQTSESIIDIPQLWSGSTLHVTTHQLHEPTPIQKHIWQDIVSGPCHSIAEYWVLMVWVIFLLVQHKHAFLEMRVHLS
jgi:hypothetical protein